MTNRSRQFGAKGLSAYLPKTRTGRLVAGGIALCCLIGSAYTMALSVSRTDRAAEGFIQKYQYVDQTTYRAR